MADHNMNNLLHTLTVGEEAPDVLNMLVEIPKGSFNKYEYIPENGVIKLDRVLFEQIPYPVEYGLIPKTWDEDEDFLDIMLLPTYPTFPGCLIEARPIGVMEMIDSGEVDDKILAVPAQDVRWNHVQDLGDVSEHTRDEIQFFFENYKTLQFKYKKQFDKKVEIKGWGDKAKAVEILNQAIDRYNKKFLS